MFKKWFKSAMALVLCAVVTASTGVSGISEMENVQVESEIEATILTDDGPSDFIKH